MTLKGSVNCSAAREKRRDEEKMSREYGTKPDRIRACVEIRDKQDENKKKQKIEKAGTERLGKRARVFDGEITCQGGKRRSPLSSLRR